MSDYPMLISNKLHSFRNFATANIRKKQTYAIIYYSYLHKNLHILCYSIYDKRE